MMLLLLIKFIIIKMKLRKNLIPLVIIGLVLLASYLVDIQKKVSVVSALLLILLIVFYKQLNTPSIFPISFQTVISRKLITTSSLIWLFFLTVITQNVNLNFETITWDVASYAVASNEISQGFLPMETQWESKGPLLFYIYNFLFDVTNNNYLYFRLINDVILFFVSVILFFTAQEITNNKSVYKSLISSSLFILLVSKVWYVSEFSELYSLFFISLSFLIFYLYKNSNNKYFFIGLFLSIASLINQGSILFLIPFILISVNDKRRLLVAKDFFYLSVSFLSLHLIFVFIYLFNGMLEIYLANYITIPLGYTGESISSFYELRVWSKGFYDHDRFLYFGLLTLIISYILSNIKKSYEFLLIFNNSFLIISLSIYFIGSHNYYHHLYYLLYFLPFTYLYIKNNKYQLIISIFILFASVSILINSTFPAYENLKSTENTYNNYPLYQLSQEIDSKFDTEYTIFALDYLFVLNYLDKTNYSYIVHPMNHFEDFITTTLIDLGKIYPKNVRRLILEEPDVIICNTYMFINGEYTKIDKEYNCEVTDYLDNYYKLDTTEYRKNDNLLYYKDPYRSIDVYIKDKKK
jgi:hypothetical protein